MPDAPVSYGSKPPIARKHCRHYSYIFGLREDSGPRCAVNVDMTGPGASACCMPDPSKPCAKREEWTDEERATWQAWQDAGQARLIKAIAAIEEPIPLRSNGSTACPNCGGRLAWSRASNGHVWLACETTQHCLGPVHFNVSPEVTWPASAARKTGDNHG